jgi:hypothetical protein
MSRRRRKNPAKDNTLLFLGLGVAAVVLLPSLLSQTAAGQAAAAQTAALQSQAINTAANESYANTAANLATSLASDFS